MQLNTLVNGHKLKLGFHFSALLLPSCLSLSVPCSASFPFFPFPDLRLLTLCIRAPQHFSAILLVCSHSRNAQISKNEHETSKWKIYKRLPYTTKRILKFRCWFVVFYLFVVIPFYVAHNNSHTFSYVCYDKHHAFQREKKEPFAKRLLLLFVHCTYLFHFD